MPYALPLVRRAGLLLTAAVLTLSAAGCDPTKDDAVIITYHPVVSFQSYEHAGKASGVKAPEMMTVYRIVSISNGGKAAKNFNFDVKNIRAGSDAAFFGNATLASSALALGVDNYLVPVDFKDTIVPGVKNYDLLPRLRVLITTTTSPDDEGQAVKLTYKDPGGRKVLMVPSANPPKHEVLSPGTSAALANFTS